MNDCIVSINSSSLLHDHFLGQNIADNVCSKIQYGEEKEEGIFFLPPRDR